MAETRTPGRGGAVTINGDGYGFGSIQAGLPERPEPPRPERQRITQAQLLKRFAWTASDFEQAQQFDFPTAGKRLLPGTWGWTLTWTTEQIDRWVQAQRERAATIARLIGGK